MLLLRVCVIGCLAALTQCAVIPTGPVLHTVQPKCHYQGKYYDLGSSFQPSPCEFCQCGGDGRPMCAMSACAAPQCVDYTHDPNQCCPVCPNGPNCQYQGHVIKQGEVYRPDAYTSCSCPGGYGYDRHHAVCLHRDVITLQTGTPK